jgi:hypothetical protein
MTLEEFYYEVCPDKVLAEYDFKNNVWNYNGTGIYSVSYEDYLKAWSEHDAIHYLLNLSQFTLEGECKVAFVEKHCGVGWAPYGDKFSANIKNKIIFPLPKGFGKRRISQTAQKLRELY